MSGPSGPSRSKGDLQAFRVVGSELLEVIELRGSELSGNIILSYFYNIYRYDLVLVFYEKIFLMTIYPSLFRQKILRLLTGSSFSRIFPRLLVSPRFHHVLDISRQRLFHFVIVPRLILPLLYPFSPSFTG